MKTILAFAVATVTFAAPALAQPKSGSWQIGDDSFHIYYADLDVTSISGRAQLLKRVERAALRLCDGDRNCTEQVVAQIPDKVVTQALADQSAARVAVR